MASMPAYALSVSEVRFGVFEGKTRMVLDVSDVTDFRTFILDSPYRIVVDLPTFDWKAGNAVSYPESGVSSIRRGVLETGVSRIIFDLDHPVAIQSAFLLPRQGEKGDRIVIDFSKIPESAVAQNLDKVFGTLSDGDTIEETSTYAKMDLGAVDLPLPAQKPVCLPKPLVVIDPGHGGNDPGALGPEGLYEKSVVLALAKELRDQLLATERYRVLMTREKDIFIRLRDRVKFARENEADLFISIHADSVKKPGTHGTSIYTLSQKASDEQTAKLAEKENQSDLIGGVDLEIEDQQVAYILGDFLMTDTMNQSKFLANTLVSKMEENGVNVLQNPHRYAGFAVLKAPDVPSVLIEAGFMSNAKEARLLNTPLHRKKMASSILKGVDAYFDQVRQNNDGG